ncbi:SprT family zinc-dependent metalloprotease [Zymomonas mobilis]|uniref:YgjP family zinc-dependent metalloprotease n=1 Tax=Zymomonas mobilis TaxID=542 RepID=UPI0039E76359
MAKEAASDIILAGVVIHILRKEIKNLYIRLSPDDGSVVVSAPRKMKEATLRHILAGRMAWIEKRQKCYQKAIEIKAQDRGEEAYWLWGEKYHLEIVSGSLQSKILPMSPSRLQMHTAIAPSAEKKEKWLALWFRAQLEQAIPDLAARWEKIIGVKVAVWRVKTMKTLWGSCNVRAGRIWLNSELVKKPPECLEYVVVHEMVHLLEASHNRRFYAFMDRFLPDWKERRERLNHFPIM